MARQSLDQELVRRGLVSTRSQAESFIRLGKVTVNRKVITKGDFSVVADSIIELHVAKQYVSRAGLKLASIAQIFRLDFRGKTVLDVGSSTGGFTDYALQHGAKKIYAVDIGTEQLHPRLRNDPRIELFEKTDIRSVSSDGASPVSLETVPDIILIDVSFISIREILPHIAQHLADSHSQIIAMVKPQFEANRKHVNQGVIKNDTVRRQLLKDFELWTKKVFVIKLKADSEVAGAKGNRERFYKLMLQ